MVLQYFEGKTSIVQWQKNVTFDVQCLEDRQSRDPVAAINIANPSEIMAYDPQTLSFCLSDDEGETWTNNTFGLPESLSIDSISFNKHAILLANTKIYTKIGNSDWQEINLPKQYKSEIPSAITQPITEAQHLFLGMKSGLVLHSTNLGKSWEKFDVIPEEDLNTLSSNGIYLVATTPTKIFFRAIPQGTWKSFNPKQESPIQIRNAIMLAPIVDSFLVLTEDGRILDGLLENDAGLRNINSERYPPDVSTIAAFQINQVIGTPQGLYSRHSWTFFDLEWWKVKW
jgi:hypothetical protein